MKRLVFFLLLAAMGSSGCDTLTGTFTANINGQAWNPPLPVAVRTGNRYTITAASSDKQMIFNIGTATGSYDMSLLEGQFQPFVYTPNLTNTNEYYIGSAGTINLTSVANNRLTGNFNITATSTSLGTIIVSGSFSNIMATN
ncbi:MAG: hypothetical protein N2167_00535 [Flavobacteriales bacterium]|nr:hypothetical protein [Flavobacteriales bacterium]